MDVMLDLETMGTRPNAPIVSIGAVFMDLATGCLGPEFYRVLDLRSVVNSGAAIDPDTLMWWLQQDQAARTALAQEARPMAEVLGDFDAFVRGTLQPDDVRIWGNGAAFDNMLLSETYKRSGTRQPWKHWNDRCYRTVKSMYPDVTLERTGTHHNALDDAKTQALHLLAIYKAHPWAL